MKRAILVGYSTNYRIPNFITFDSDLEYENKKDFYKRIINNDKA